jgi:hypothetical protein
VGVSGKRARIRTRGSGAAAGGEHGVQRKVGGEVRTHERWPEETRGGALKADGVGAAAEWRIRV